MHIAIVGPEENKWTKEQKTKAKLEIRWLFNRNAKWKYKDEITHNDILDYSQIIIISGHCPKAGVDIWAEEIADELGIQKEIYPAEVHQWNDIIQPDRITENEPLVETKLKGYRSRNMQIAEACDVLYCIVPKTGKDEPVIEGTWKLTPYCKHCMRYGHPTNGGCWTLKKAKELGKETHLVVIE